MRVHPRFRIDISPGRIVGALASCLRLNHADAEGLATTVESQFGPAGESLFTLSVRSAFDLALTALAFPAGSELVCSGVTIPDMAELARAHGLVVVPVDLEPGTFAPTAASVERALTPRTRGVLIAHLYGGRIDLTGIAEVCRRHRIPLLEDCAQAFAGPTDWGSAEALISFFSFGPIKTCTALGGAVSVVRDAPLRSRMRALHAAWPRQSSQEFARRAARFLALSVLQNPWVFGGFWRLCSLLGADADAFLSKAVKGFAPGRDAMLRGIRRQPSAPLGALLARRLRGFSLARLQRRTSHGERVIDSLRGVALVPGAGQPTRTHWLVPVSSADPEALVCRLRAEGFDAAQGTTSLVALDEALEAHRVLSSVVYLPAYPELPEPALERMIAIVREGAGTGPLGSIPALTPALSQRERGSRATS